MPVHGPGDVPLIQISTVASTCLGPVGETLLMKVGLFTLPPMPQVPLVVIKPMTGADTTALFPCPSLIAIAPLALTNKDLTAASFSVIDWIDDA